MSVFAVGNTLACFEEDARSFLFPEPKLVHSFSGVDREVLMTRASHFPVGQLLKMTILSNYLFLTGGLIHTKVQVCCLGDSWIFIIFWLSYLWVHYADILKEDGVDKSTSSVMFGFSAGHCSKTGVFHKNNHC